MAQQIFDHKLWRSRATPRSRIFARKNSAAPSLGPRGQVNFIEGTNVTITVADDEPNDELDVTIASTAAGVKVRKNTGSTVGPRARLNFIEGTDIAITVADDSGDDEVDITITSTIPGAGLFQPWYTPGQYYPETFAPFGSTALEKQVSGGSTWGSACCLAPFYNGGVSRTYDRIGCFARFASSPGTSPEMKFVVFALNSATLFPTGSPLYDGSLFAVSGTTPGWFEDTISLTTSALWLGIGWLKVSEASGFGETIALRTPGVTTVAADNHQGYCPYGNARSVDTLTPSMSIYAEAAQESSTVPSAASFAITVPSAVTINGHLGSGVYLRRSA